jgi:phosphoglycerol transferase MdoB-like AlkP superfamily enzyme
METPAATDQNQFRLLAVVLIGALVLSTVAFALNMFLIGYLLIRYTSAWRTYRSYAITSAVLILAVWLTLLVGASVVLPTEKKATEKKQFAGITSISLIALIGFLAAAAVSAIGLAQSQRTLTSDLMIVRTYFGTLLGLTAVAFFWVIIGGGIAMAGARKSFYTEGLADIKDKEAKTSGQTDTKTVVGNAKAEVIKWEKEVERLTKEANDEKLSLEIIQSKNTAKSEAENQLMGAKACLKKTKETGKPCVEEIEMVDVQGLPAAVQGLPAAVQGLPAAVPRNKMTRGRIHMSYGR